MKRIGIFCFYDKEGIVDNYIEFLLEDLSHCLNSLIIVINGEINDSGRLIFEKYADEIYVRENKGFDGGAYKDVIVNLFGWNRIQEYDELVLCNDTFYGPFVSFEEIFDEASSRSVDFWGMNYCNNKILGHLQSYFLVFRKKVIQDGKMLEYIEKNIDISLRETTSIFGEFEIGLFYYLVNQGYSFWSYSEDTLINIYKCSNVCIKECGIPLLKKKAFSPINFIQINIMDTLKYLSHNTKYNIDFILSNIKRLYDVTITKQEIEEFVFDEEDVVRIKYPATKIKENDIKKLVVQKKSIYIYGLGIFAGIISKIVDICNGKIEGYIVSNNQYNVPKEKKDVKVYKISELDDEDNMVIIVALNKDYTEEVKPYLKRFKEVMFLW